MERKIGEIFIYKNKIYKVVKANTCKDCALSNALCHSFQTSVAGSCTPGGRKDNLNVVFKEINNMEIKNNQLTIDIPEGHIIDVKHSDLSKGIIKFKRINITYKDIEDALNLEENLTGVACNVNNVAKLSAIDKLINIANYYNKGWKPDWNNGKEYKYYILFNNNNESSYSIECRIGMNYGSIFFKNKEDAQAVIDNPNFREILDEIFKN